jgi:hypothetical protein
MITIGALHESCTKILKLWEAPPWRLQSAPLSTAGVSNDRMSTCGRTSRDGPPFRCQADQERSITMTSFPTEPQDLKWRLANPTQMCGALALLAAAIAVTTLADFPSYRHAPASQLRSLSWH